MRRLLLAAAAPLLWAQGAHYEGGLLIHPTTVEQTIRFARLPEAIASLAFTGQDGRTRTVDLPPELDGRLGRSLQIAYHRGMTYAVGFMHVPIPPGKAGREALKQAYFQMPHRLYACGSDGRWSLMAHLDSNMTFRQSAFLPLGGGRFLYGHPGLCWQGEVASPFGVYQARGGELHLERLVDLGLGGPWYRAVPLTSGSEEAKRFGRGPKISETYQELEGYPASWQVLRLPSGLCFLHLRSRRWFLLDEQATRRLGQGRIGGAGPAEILGAAVRPDGRVLMATRPGTVRERVNTVMAKASVLGTAGPRQKPGEALLAGRAEALQPAMPQADLTGILWRILDPLSGQVWETPPPAHCSIRPSPFAPLSLDLHVLPNGHLRVAQDNLWRERPSRLRYDWLDRLLKPFTHDWRKLQP